MRLGLGRRRFRSSLRAPKIRGFLITIIACYIIISMFVMFDKQLKTVVLAMAEADARQISTKVINQSVSDKLSKENITYTDLVTLVKNEQGEIKALQANIIEINRLKADLSLDILNNIAKENNSDLGIPIGSIINKEIFLNRGPRIPVKIVPLGSTEVNFISNFETAGINQTRHEINIQTLIHVSIVLPSGTKIMKFESCIPVAETLIIGSVPESYTNIEGVSGSIPDIKLDMLGE